ncbi:hypothetical protein MASR2M18_17620 [Ignavibacteria bacterium]|nr:TonB-dependent receptor plug domain-containing protein [Bacteroidota bacterium]MCZ2133381.1 TonB-dependent receptor plug domain-containing protein [Bacteroidota bacterium]
MLLVAGGADLYSAASDTLYAVQKPVADTPDSARNAKLPSLPVKSHGLISQFTMPECVMFGKRDIEKMPYFELTDILRQTFPAAFPQSLGGFGGFNSFSVFGGNAHDNSLRFNARPLVSPMFGTFLLDQFPPEMLERTEILTGTDAVVFGDNSSGMLINIQEAIHDVKKPYTRLWYAQSDYNFIASDGVFSQNFAPDWNGTFGFRRQSYDGRFNNSGFDIWNVRFGLRFSPSDKTTFTLTELFTNHGFGANGGLMPDNTDFTNPITALPRISDLDERVFRHDITLAGSWRPDSGFAANGSAYFSGENWEINRGSAYFTGVADTLRLMQTRSAFVGAVLRLEQKISDILFLRAGGDLTWVNSAASVYADVLSGVSAAGYIHASWASSAGISLRSGARIRIDQDRTSLSLGAAVAAPISSQIAFTADFSRSDRAPSPTEGRNLPSEKHLLALAGLRFGPDSSGIIASMFSRYISSPIESIRITDTNGNTLGTHSFSGDSRAVVGGFIRGRTFLFKRLFAQCWAQSYFGGGAELPALFGGISAQYEYKAGASSLIAGFSVSGITAYRGETFVPQTWNYVATENETPAAFDGCSVFATAKLGNARLRAVYSNLFSAHIEYTPYYPDLDRTLRISLSWAFND